MEHNRHINGGLIELPEKKPGETQDFSRTAVFGSIRAQDLPAHDFEVAPPQDIKDQDSEDFCTFYASAEANEDQEGVALEQYFNAYVGKVLIQKDPDSWGCDLRTAMRSHLAPYGALELEFSPFRNWPQRPTREEVLDPKNWIDDHFQLAYEHRKNSFFKVDGPHDRFNNYLAALWMHKKQLRSIVTGVKWRSSWTDAPNGVIPETGWESDSAEPHAIKIFGQKFINNEPHLIAQLSNGDEIGNKGLFYFPRSIINAEFTYGEFMFEDMPREVAETHLYYGTSVQDGFFRKFYKIAATIVADFFKRFI